MADVSLKVAELYKAIRENEEKTSGERFSLFPIPKSDGEQFKFWKRQDASIWFAEELKLADDLEDFTNLSLTQPELSSLIIKVFRFFANGDGAVGDVVALKLIAESETACERNFYISQSMIEKVHEETYNLYIEEMVRDPALKKGIFTSCDTIPQIGKKIEYIEDVILVPQERRISRARLAAAELIFFASLFSIIFYFRTTGKLIKLIAANKLILHDETLHYTFGCYQSKRAGGLSQEEGEAIIREAVEIEQSFSEYILTKDHGPLSVENLKKYVRFSGDVWLVEMGLAPIFHDENPFDWMAQIALETRTNFFETETTEYKRFSVADSMKLVGGKRPESRGEDVFNEGIDF